MIEMIIVVLIILLLVISYALWNQTRKITAFEETLSLYEGWIQNFAITVEKVDTDLDDLDADGTFRADDEVGYFFQAMYSILKRLEEFKLIEPEEENEAEDLLYEGNRERNRRIQRVRRSEIQIEDIQKQDRKTFKQTR